MTDQTHAPDPAPADGADTTAPEAPGAHVAQEGRDAAAFFGDLAQRAQQVRAANDYQGTLTAKMLVELAPVMHERTPQRYVKHIPAVNPGKPYPSTGLNSAQFQIDMMNAGYGRAHWRALRHYPPASEGFMCKVVVIAGNNLVAASLDPAGELVRGDADILAVSEEWGAVKNATTPADAYKGSATNAIKRALAAFGPGGDVYRLEFGDENIGGSGDYQAPQPNRSPDASAGPRVASAAQQRLIKFRASQNGVDDATLACLILHVAGAPPLAFETAQQATAYLEQLLAALPGHMVDNVLEAIAAAAHRQACPPVAPAAMAPAHPPVQSDIPNDLDTGAHAAQPMDGVVPLAPAAVVPSANGATPHAA